MQFTNKATTTGTGQRKPRKPLIAAAVGAGVLLPVLAVGSPAMAATWGPARSEAGMVQLDSSVRHLPGLRGSDGRFGWDQRDVRAGHPGPTQPPAGNGQGTGGTTSTSGGGTTSTSGGGTTSTSGGGTTSTSDGGTTTTSGGGTTTTSGGGTTTGCTNGFTNSDCTGSPTGSFH